MFFRIFFNSFFLIEFKLILLNVIFPEDVISFKIASTREVLPEPDSPTIPIVSFSFKVKLISSIALI